MSNSLKEILPRENGELVEMQTPIIVSASRSTDIPAFYCEWFFHRLKVGYSAWTNPFNGLKSFISYKKTRFIVFWSKNPKPLIKYLPELKRLGIDCYIQYSLNDYENEGLEKNIPKINERIDTFKKLVSILGKERVIWRFDPLILTDKIDEDLLINKIDKIGSQLFGFTEKLVFSFVDIDLYRKVQTNLIKARINYLNWNESSMRSFGEKLSKLNSKWHFELATCGERIDLTSYGINKNHCIDDNLIIRLSYNNKTLMEYLNVKIIDSPQEDIFGSSSIPEDAILLPDGRYATHGNNRDRGQRIYCGCIKSKDIGEYNTCIHGCEYCYANSSKEIARQNYKTHHSNTFQESII